MEKFIMKYQVAEQFKKRILLSELKLNMNDFSKEWLNGFFINPILKNAVVYDNNKITNVDLYLNFSFIDIDKNIKGDDFFTTIHHEIKKYIVDEWGHAKKISPVYNFYHIKSEIDDKKRVLFIYLSPAKANKLFDFDKIPNQDNLICNILEMLIKSSFIEQLNKTLIINTDIFSGKLFLNPEITEFKSKIDKKNKYAANVFSYKLTYADFKLGFNLKNEHFLLDNLANNNIYNDICSINQYKYEKKLDARTYSRLFLDFKNYEHLKKTRFITQLELYKTILYTLDKFDIKYEKTVFIPEYLFNEFNHSQYDLNNINIHISSINKDTFNNVFAKKNIPNNFESMLLFLNQKNINLTLNIDSSLDTLLSKPNETHLFLMYGNKDNFVREIDNTGKETTWNDVTIPFLERKLWQDDKITFLKSIQTFDIYSQVKLYNLYANKNGKNPIISQGLFLNDNMQFTDIRTKEEIKRNKKDTIPKKNVALIFNKVLNELDIKNKMLFHKKFYLKTFFPCMTENDVIHNVKIIQKKSKEKNSLYSYVELSNMNQNNTSCFDIINSKLIIDDEINSLSIDFDFNTKLQSDNNIIIINDLYCLKVKNNNFVPFIILEEQHIDNPLKDPSLLIKQHIQAGTSLSTNVPKLSAPDVNLFFPYNIPTISKITNQKIKKKNENESAYSNCMFEFHGNDINIYMTLGRGAIGNNMNKNNRLENIQLFKLKDFSFIKENWEEHEQLLLIYLSSLTFDYLSINELTKKSLLNKLADIILFN
jgi:hypothetical protein